MSQNEMIDRFATAMYDALMRCEGSQIRAGEFGFQTADDGGTILDGSYDLAAIARAVIEAMREPTEDQVVDGFEAMVGDWRTCKEAADDARRCWRAMIAAALK